MTPGKINEILTKTKSKSALVHCITNHISANQCANTILAVGARPIMAENPREVREITKTSQALLLNLGNITDTRMKSMEISAAESQNLSIPVVLDLVGVACSKLRRDFAKTLTNSFRMSVIKGNYSEIKAMYDCTYKSSGVDSEPTLNMYDIISIAAELASRYGCVTLASGEKDIVTDGNIILCIKNGTPRLSCITGTGCMLGALAACCLTGAESGEAVEASAAACAVLGICGELCESVVGNGSFMMSLIDKLSLISAKDIEQRLNMEEVKVEKF